MKRRAGKWPLRQGCHPAACILRTASACPERCRRIQRGERDPSTGSGQAAWGPDSRVRRSPSISVSEQRAPGLAAVGSIDASRLALKGQIRHTGSVRILSAGYPPSLLWSLGGCIVPATPPEAAPQRRVVTGAHCAANGAAQWRTRKHWPACRRPSGPPVRRASCPRAGSARTIHDHGNPVRGFAVSPKGCTSPSRRRVRRIAAREARGPSGRSCQRSTRHDCRSFRSMAEDTAK